MRLAFKLRPLVTFVMLCACASAAAAAQPQPVPVPSAAPSAVVPNSQQPPNPQATANASPAASASPSASPRPLGLRFSTDAGATFIDQNTSGPGQTSPEAPGFINGAPFAPDNPYDLFSSAPQVPGLAGIGQIVSTATYGFRNLDASLTAGLGYVNGSITNATYWGESLMPTLNPHLGSQALPYQIAFPNHPGQDDGIALRTSILGGALATADGNFKLRGGYFDLAQTDRFVFAPPALTNVNPAIGFAPAESLGNGPPNLSDWLPYSQSLPLQGIDFTGKRGDATLELTDAGLAALPGTPARLTMGSLVFDRGEGTRFSVQLAHVATGGVPIVTTVPFGANPSFTLYPTGVQPLSFLNGQRQTLAGVRAAFHALPAENVDAVIEIGRAWYDSDGAALPGTNKPGGFYHGGVTKTQGRVTASLDYYRFEPRYGTAILPYGVTENQWSAAFAWPGQWLKSNYQLVDNSVLGINRQGYRLRYYVDGGPLEVHLEYVDLHQIDPETTQTSEQLGYVDGFYLPQLPADATFGRQKRVGFWTAWHPAGIGDFTLDIVDDSEYRGFAASHPEDQVSFEVPQAVLSFSRKISPNVTGSVGYGRYAIKGAFAEPIDIAQRTFLTGAEIKESPLTSLLINFRRSAVRGTPTTPGGTLPDFTSSAIVVEQRLHL